MSNKYAANHIYSNIGQVPYPFFPLFLHREQTDRIYVNQEDNPGRVSEVCECSGGLYQPPPRRRNRPEIAGQDFPFLSVLLPPHHEGFFGRTHRYVYRPDTYRNGSTVIALHRFADSRHCLSHRLFVFLIIV